MSKINTEHTRSKNQKNQYKKIEKDDVCPFCPEHLSAYHKGVILAENKNWKATKNDWPYAGTKNHLLYIPKRHVEHIYDLTEKEWSDLRLLLLKSRKETDIDGGTFFIRSGNTEKTGGSVSHLHAHFIEGERGRMNGSPIRIKVGYKKAA